ncbi:Hypothetical_protein [Hexamita inflata]|uniref:Hypothetical_protein n=1 Tax=Hexamita inflata TaxID=28002 RepID=A0AA86P8W9_9EUKA|nr:Hypothetical protein HINF_LOCUS20020 [Hexamita inflata]
MEDRYGAILLSRTVKNKEKQENVLKIHVHVIAEAARYWVKNSKNMALTTKDQQQELKLKKIKYPIQSIQKITQLTITLIIQEVTNWKVQIVAYQREYQKRCAINFLNQKQKQFVIIYYNMVEQVEQDNFGILNKKKLQNVVINSY